MDVTGKLVLVDINQRDEWWINYPVYQAHLKGAAAVIAAQTGGYGEVDERALNAQDIAGPSNAPAFSIARRDADQLKKMLQGRSEVKVLFDASTKVIPAQTTYNIVGEIPGKTHPERRIMLSAHYDSYFDGFQDDNCAIALMFGVLAGVLTWVAGPSKGIFAVGKAGYLPPFFQKTNKNGVQKNILLIQGCVVTLLALLVVILASLFEDRLNAWFAKKRLLPGTEHAAATFEEDGYVSATGVTESRFSYAQIVAVAETARYFVFALSSHHTQAYDKRTIRGGSVEDFRAFIAEKTGKLVENIK